MKSKSSKRWLQEHVRDPYVQKAQKQGMRSRAAYKLEEIQQKDRIVSAGMTLLELGAAPGGFTQLLTKWVGKQGKIFALDLLPMDAIPNVTFLQGDFTDENFLQELDILLANQEMDCVISDMSPNISGIKTADQARMLELAVQTLHISKRYLKQNGSLVMKLFQGEDFANFIKQIKQFFAKVTLRKPEASRDRSPEIYLVAKGFKAAR